MFKKLVTLMIAVAFTTTAFAGSNPGLKSAFDELNYSLTVEWNQKDKSFYDAQMKKFKDTLAGLQAKGLTNAELIEFVKAEVKDAKVAKDMQTAFTMIQIQKMSASDAANYMTETMKKSYSTGASWNGEAVMYIGIGVLLIAVAVAVAASAGHGGGGSYGGGGYCEDVYVCDTYCYDDYYWGYTCDDDCYWSCY
ncbi:MAG: hypothetical protein ACJ76H_04380 [Bacteriovoracaceae bacterium]